ncbi:hypothetical protein [Wolbachia endosymbiont of Ctenocephalides felis wCfeT]|uniref:hypothetical protein n=1 Tax=Wolbachia endosymbiont of Ctenocephalides felis wCfeT TaxID=2732593 RepID=UPI0014472E75|nr:hypothetical protein [Wolbachia endosymbiont of Ctenocephalides felis wCfeT]
MNNLDEWRENVIKFLSSRRKYRILGGEFGPTLLDELSCSYGYIRIGTVLIPIAALSAGLISLIVTRKIELAAAVTSSFIVLMKNVSISF